MSRRLALYALITLAGLGLAWFFSTFERARVPERVPPSGEARVRDFLAAERFAERMGLRSRELRSLADLDNLAPGMLLVPNQRASIDASRAARLLAWAQEGNHLVVEAELPGLDDPLLDALQVKRAQGKPQEKPPFLDQLSLEAPAVKPALQIADKLVSFPRGKGMVTVASSLNFARNRLIGAQGSAELLWQLIELTPAKELQVFFRPQRLSLTGFLVQHALPALIAAGVLLALWLWRIALRFGPVVPDAPPARRRLLDHLRASGRYYWAQGLRASLVLAARDAALRRIARSQPDFSTASITEKQQRLAALAGIRPEEAAQFLAAGGAMRGHDFIRVVQRAQRVHVALEKGGR
jgi:hypothetical protein